MTGRAFAFFWICASGLVAAQDFTPVADPTFNYPSGSYRNVFWLAMTTATEGAVVRFTTDGAEPTESSAPFTEPMLVTSSAVFKARAFAAGRPASATATVSYDVQIPQRTAQSILHVVPTMYQGNPAGFLEACLHMDQWPDVLARTTSLGTSNSLAEVSDVDLAACFSAMASQGLQLTLEGGIVNRVVTSGAAQFATDSLFWRRFIGLGAPLSTIFLQEPFTAAVGGPLSHADIVRETATYMALIRLHFPGMKLILQEAYPYQSASAIIDLIRDVNAAAEALAVAGLDGFELDHDWNARRWSVSDVYRINEFVRTAGMTFSIILWQSGRQPAPDCDFGVRIYNQDLSTCTRPAMCSTVRASRLTCGALKAGTRRLWPSCRKAGSAPSCRPSATSLRSGCDPQRPFKGAEPVVRVEVWARRTGVQRSPRLARPRRRVRRQILGWTIFTGRMNRSGQLVQAILSRNVGQPDHILANPIMSHKAERRPGPGEIWLAVTKHDGVQVDSILIDQAKFGQALRQLRASNFDLPVALGLQLADRALQIILNKPGVGADRLQRARDDPFRLISPRRREGVFLCVPFRMIVVPVTHDLIHVATVDTARLPLSLLDEVAEERGPGIVDAVAIRRGGARSSARKAPALARGRASAAAAGVTTLLSSRPGTARS